jgi:hypothetical protein
MQQEPLDGKPLSKPGDQALLDAYYQEPVKQAERFADLAKELFKLELAIPGIYAAALRVVGGEQSANRMAVLVAFAFWMLALILTLRAIFPRKYEVLENVVRSVRLPLGQGPLSIEEYFQRSMRDKRRLLLGSIPLFCAGIVAAVLAVLV